MNYERKDSCTIIYSFASIHSFTVIECFLRAISSRCWANQWIKHILVSLHSIRGERWAYPYFFKKQHYLQEVWLLSYFYSISYSSLHRIWMEFLATWNYFAVITCLQSKHCHLVWAWICPRHASVTSGIRWEKFPNQKIIRYHHIIHWHWVIL